MSTLNVPMVMNTMKDNLSEVEFNIIKDVVENLEDLQNLFIYAKQLQMAQFYELMAASIACFFKSHTD